MALLRQSSRQSSLLRFNRQNSRVSFGTFMFEAARQGDWQNLQLILDQKGAVEHIDHTDKYGQTPLTIAASKGHLRCVKILLMNKCNLYCVIRLEGQELYAWDLASKNGHKKVAQYLQGCVDDLVNFKYHRATMEADIYEICQASQSPTSDLCEFDDLLRKLVDHCGYNVNGDEEETPLLLIASRSDNQPIVQRLLETFKATPYANDPDTGETALHVACRAMSPLRFYITTQCPDLLETVDIKGCSPLHDACMQNDVEFLSWLFQEQLKSKQTRAHSSTSLSLSSSITEKISPSSLHQIEEEEEEKEVKEEEDDEKERDVGSAHKYGSSPLNDESVYTAYRRLFAVATDGRSILHIAARDGHADLLGVILQAAKSLTDDRDSGVDLQVMVRRDSSCTPIDEAISHSRPECLRLLLDFALGLSDVNDKILADTSLLKIAVLTRNLSVMSVLLEMGVWSGLQFAIILAARNNLSEMVRLLMFYHTQVVCVTNSMQLKRSGHLRVSSGAVNWSELNMSELAVSWLFDAVVAVNSVHGVVRCMPSTQPAHQSPELFRNLGVQCVQYFKTYVWASSPSSLPSPSLLNLTELDISNNQLCGVPPELFQLKTLEQLKLSNNLLDALPSSLNFQDPLYTCTGLRRLDVSHNKLRTLPEDLFVSVGLSLEELNARNNMIDSLPPALWICPHLQTLELGHNQLTLLHYFSDPKLFYDQPFSQKLIRAIKVEGGSPVQQPITSDEEFTFILKYITRLNLFYMTAKIMFPEVFEESKPTEHLVQHVVDIHWLRSKLSRDRTSMDIWDVQLHSDNMCSLSMLNLSYNKFTEFPWDLACVAPNLQKLDFRENPGVKSLDLIRDIPANISSLIINSCGLTTVSSQRPAHPCASPVKLLAGYLTDPHYCHHCSHACLSQLSNLVMDSNKLLSFPVLASSKNHDSTDAAPQVLYPCLSVLSLSNNSLSAVPEGLHHMTQLSSISLSYNTSITKLPQSLGLVNPQVMLVLKLDGLFIKNIPSHLLEKARAKPIISYLKSLYQKSQAYYRIKLMLVGNCNKGKTSLLLNLTRKGKITRFKDVEFGLNKQPLSTVGVDLGDWEYTPTRKPRVTFMTWDFGGQEEYYATHQCFLTQRSLYLLVWSARDGEMGLKELKVWMENIGSRIPGAPVIVVATHSDLLPSNRRSDIIRQLNVMFRDLYLAPHHAHFAYPDVHSKCYFVSCSDGTQIGALRDAVYDVALSIRAPGSRKDSGEFLLKQPVPASYIKLQDIVRELAHRCAAEHRVPIFTAKEYRTLVWDKGFPERLDELDEATSFLHENGILLHYDEPSLSDLYFVDPQWLGSMLSCVVTVQEKNPFQKNGFMEVSSLTQVLRNDKFPPSVMTHFIHDFISLMQKFEIVLLLDKDRLLIPSLLPPNELNTSVVLPNSLATECPSTAMDSDDLDLHTLQNLSRQPFAGIASLSMRIIGRYYLLPFIPNGFFPHLIARVIGSKITSCVLRSLQPTSSSFLTDKLNMFNSLHWRCWREGIMLLWCHMEIFRIAPTTLPPQGVDSMVVISSSGRSDVKHGQRALEIKIACLPEQQLRHSHYLPKDPNKSRSMILATWLLQQATDIIDAVFNDWYEPFSRRSWFDINTVEQACPCVECLGRSLVNQYKMQTSIVVRKPTCVNNDFEVVDPFSWKHFYLFSSPYCVLMASRGSSLMCPVHREVAVDTVAPDLAFYDLPASMLYHNPADVTMSDHPLGSGGFGSVYAGRLTVKDRVIDVAIKQFTNPLLSLKKSTETDHVVVYSDVEEESAAWSIYTNSSREGRMMYQLQHTHILGLVGVAFQPLRLLLELAPRGDLKHCLMEFKDQKVKLNRKTLRAVMVQLADALDYIHSQHIIYRDLKPGNVLVWEFPAPRSQWRQDATVLLKLADYGISKMCSADGARGTEGTPAYLPPEVILRSETFTTKLDSYSFGMFLYYLFTLSAPFEKETGRPISALLDEGKRPQFSTKDRPAALQMFELMCWCWSDRPQDRPDFTQIKSAISSNTFTRLLGVSQILEQDSFMCVCLHRFTPPTLHSRSSEEQLTSSLKRASATPSPAIVNLFVEAAAVDEERVVQVWYGSKRGRLGYVQFLMKETSTEEVATFSRPVNTLCVINRMIWVGTKGAGIRIFNPSTTKLVAVWAEEGEVVVHKLLPVKESGLVFALSSVGVVVFDGAVPHSDNLINLVPCNSIAFTDNLMVGVVSPERGVQEDPLLWCCPGDGHHFKVIDGTDKQMHGVKEIPIPNLDRRTEPQTKHMECCEVDTENRIVLADRHIVTVWSVMEMVMVNHVDCSRSCQEIYGDTTQQSVVTSLLAVREKLYIGTMGGVILILSSSLSTLHLLHGHDNPVRCLQAINHAPQMRRFSRMYSRYDVKSVNPTSPLLSEVGSVTSSLSSSSDNDSVDRELVLSFGQGYRGVVGDVSNYPHTFNLPSESLLYCPACSRANCTCREMTLRQPKPNPDIGCMLYWSSEEQTLLPEDMDNAAESTQKTGPCS